MPPALTAWAITPSGLVVVTVSLALAAVAGALFAANLGERRVTWSTGAIAWFVVAGSGVGVLAVRALADARAPSTVTTVALAIAAAATVAALAPAARRPVETLLPLVHGDAPVHALALALAPACLAAVIWLHAVLPVERATSGTVAWAGVGRLLAVQAGLVAVGLLGTGLFTRRDLPEVAHRLRLARIDRSGVISAAAIGIGAAAAGVVGAAAVHGGARRRAGLRAAELLLGGHFPLAAALVLAIAGAVGEEVVLRGALRPRFGNLTPSALFCAAHLAVVRVPTVVGLFAFGMILGRLWQRRGLAGCVIAHAAALATLAILMVVLR